MYKWLKPFLSHGSSYERLRLRSRKQREGEQRVTCRLSTISAKICRFLFVHAFDSRLLRRIKLCKFRTHLSLLSKRKERIDYLERILLSFTTTRIMYPFVAIVFLSLFLAHTASLALNLPVLHTCQWIPNLPYAFESYVQSNPTKTNQPLQTRCISHHHPSSVLFE